MNKGYRMGRWLLILLTTTLWSLQTQAATATLSIEEFDIKAGETKEMLIDVNNPSMDVTMVEFYLRLPTGLSIVIEDGDPAVDIVGRTTLKKHSLRVETSEDVTHILLYSGSNALISGTSGAVIGIKLMADNSFNGGDIQLENQLLTSPALVESKPSTYTYKIGVEPKPGDDEIITFADNYVEQLCLYYWDTNRDGYLSKQEAAAVTSLGDIFCLDLSKKKSWQTDDVPKDGLMHGNLSSFDELQYFTGLTTLDDGAFHSQLSLQSVTLPESLKTIGKGAFYGCNVLKSIVVPDAVETISDEAFWHCTNLATITLGSSVKTIGNYAFCKAAVREMTIPEGCVSIGSLAFFECGSLSKVSIPATVTSIGSWAFGYVKSPLSIHVGDVEAWQKVTISCLDDEDPDEEGLLSTHASYRLYNNNQEVTSITVPKSVTSIGNIMKDCISLTSLTIHKDVTQMTVLAFNGCSNLSSVTSYIESPFYIEDAVFESWNQSTGEDRFTTATLYVPAGTKSQYKSQYGWKKFETITEMGGSPTQAEPYVVYNDGTLTFYCDNQRSSRLGTTYDLNVGEEEPAWYENRSSVTKVVFDSSFASARPTTGHEWFDGCISLTEIEGMEYLNTSEMTFMDEMFIFCNSLSSVDLSHFDTSNVTDMRAMFSGCSGLMSIDLSRFDTQNVKNVGAMFYSCSSLTEIDLSNFDTSKATTNYILRDCTNLREVTFGQKFESSEHQWFVDAFDGCTSIKTIKFTGDIPACINSKFFTGVGTSDAPATLIVPGQYKDNYQAKFDGKKFFSGYFVLKTFSDDGVMNKEDIAEVVSEILNPSGEYDPNKDVNHDGVVNVADVVELVNIINSGEGTGSGYFWMGNYLPNSNNFPTINGKEVEGIVTTYTSLDDAMAKASRTYSAGEYAIVMYPSSWGTKDDLVFLDNENKKYYATKQKKLSDFPDYLYYESTEKIGDNTTITLSTVVAAKATGATLSSPKIQ